MLNNASDLVQMLSVCFDSSRSIPCNQTEPKLLHSERSRNWVEGLATAFRKVFTEQPDVKVFSKYCDKNRLDFGLNELLYDVCVCRTSSCDSYTGKTLQYVTEALWLVESEFERDTKQALFDFNKLVIGRATHKLFVGPAVSNPERFLSVLLPAARDCVRSASESLYVALLSHPQEWSSSTLPPNVWQLRGQSWSAV